MRFALKFFRKKSSANKTRWQIYYHYLSCIHEGLFCGFFFFAFVYAGYFPQWKVKKKKLDECALKKSLSWLS